MFEISKAPDKLFSGKTRQRFDTSTFSRKKNTQTNNRKMPFHDNTGIIFTVVIWEMIKGCKPPCN